MIKFDPDSIYNRLLSRLQQNPDWNIISNNSVVDALIRSNAEINAETARYAEYLFKESKWDTAQNYNSILAMANMLGYQPKRKISTRGEIVVSLDPRIHQIGKSLPHTFLKNDLSNTPYANWKVPGSISVPITSQTTTIKDSRGVSYIAIDTEYSGNNKYHTLNLIQGERKSLNISKESIVSLATSSKLDPYLYIPVVIDNCEDASNPTSRAFFRVFLERKTGSESATVKEEYRIVNSLLLSTSSDKDVEIYNDIYNQKLFYLKFNNDPRRGKIINLTKNTNVAGITIEYIETKGASGNLEDVFTTFNITTTLNNSPIRLYGINFQPFTNGSDEETIIDIKKNAPKYYIMNYTAGTKEAYERTILNTEFNVINDKGVTEHLIPTAVNVFAGKSRNPANKDYNVTKISFLASNLDDILDSAVLNAEDIITETGTVYSYNSILSSIDESLNYTLARLKSPQDTLEFEPPVFIDFAVGINCKVSKDSTIDLSLLEANIRQFIESEWSSKSSKISFNRNFYPSQITNQIMNNYPSIISTSFEVEAITKVDWVSTRRIRATNFVDTSNINVYTFRSNFSFSPIFYGSKSLKGFKDLRSGSEYMLRVDILYKVPKGYNGKNYNSSIFVEDNILRSAEQPFYVASNVTNKVNWDIENYSEGENSEFYDMLQSSKALNLSDTSGEVNTNSVSRQYAYQGKVYGDNEYTALLTDTEAGLVTLSNLTARGSLGDYLIYFAPNYQYTANSTDSIGDGWIELPFDSVYEVLEDISFFDVNLSRKLQDCALSTLKCGTVDSEVNTVLASFKELLTEYVEIHVCMRPIDSDLNTSSLGESARGSTILQIDSSDKQFAGYTVDFNKLSETKRPRMISVSCKYEE